MSAVRRFADLSPAELVVVANHLRQQWSPRHALITGPKGGRYLTGGFISFTRAELVAHCEELAAGMRDHHDALAAEDSKNRAPSCVHIDTYHDDQTMVVLTRLSQSAPRAARMALNAGLGLV